MRYVKDEEEYHLHITTESKDTSVSDPGVIRDELEDASERINPCHKSNRSMWPEEELIGVSIDESEYFSGKITGDKFKISVDSHTDFDRAYNQLKIWLSSSKVGVPKKQSFRVTGFTFLPSYEEEVVMYDTAKAHTKDQILGHVYELDGLKANYSSVQGMTVFTVVEPENGLPVSKLDYHVENMLDQNLLVIGRRNEMVDPEERDESSSLQG